MKRMDERDGTPRHSWQAGAGKGGRAPKLRVIFVEDEDELRELLVAILTRFGHDARGAGDGVALDRLLADYPADVIVLDLNLPGEDGISIARRLRAGSNCGIIMTTSRGQLTERLEGFECGADIYYTKPIEPVELNAAIENLARRVMSPPSPEENEAWQFDPKLAELTTPRGVKVRLSARECIVMELLLASPGETVPRLELFAALGHRDDVHSDSSVETLFSRLRSKVGSLDPLSKLPIRARHSLGYAFLGAARAGGSSP